MTIFLKVIVEILVTCLELLFIYIYLIKVILVFCFIFYILFVIFLVGTLKNWTYFSEVGWFYGTKGKSKGVSSSPRRVEVTSITLPFTQTICSIKLALLGFCLDRSDNNSSAMPQYTMCVCVCVLNELIRLNGWMHRQFNFN